MQCARHNQDTVVGCGRCDAPVCPKCMVYTDVGVRCRDCSPRQRSRPVWGGSTVLIGAGLLFLIIFAIGSFASVGLYSGGGGQTFSDFPDMAELEPRVGVEQLVDPWVPEADGAQPAEGQRFVAIEVTVTGRSSGVGQFASAGLFKLTDSGKFAYSARSDAPKAPALGEVPLAAGEKATGWVVFEIDAENEIRSLTYGSVRVDLP